MAFENMTVEEIAAIVYPIVRRDFLLRLREDGGLKKLFPPRLLTVEDAAEMPDMPDMTDVPIKVLDR
jgi:hypothetical protein